MKHATLKKTTRPLRMSGVPSLAVAAFLVALASDAWADGYLNPIGGGGGGQFEARCPVGQLLAGFEVRAADDVDAIRPLCVTATGPRDVSGASPASGWHGGAGGVSASVACPAQTPIVTGMFVRWEGVDTYVVNNIHLFCGTADATQGTGNGPAAVFNAPQVRPSGLLAKFAGTGQATQLCPDGQVAVGMHGRSGIWVDAIALICGEPPISMRPKSIAKVGAGPARPAGWTICDRARDARGRESPAAPALEAQCAAYEATGKAMAKVPIPKDNGQLPMSICDLARDSRARKSPVAPSLEERCLASGGKL